MTPVCNTVPEYARKPVHLTRCLFSLVSRSAFHNTHTEKLPAISDVPAARGGGVFLYRFAETTAHNGPSGPTLSWRHYGFLLFSVNESWRHLNAALWALRWSRADTEFNMCLGFKCRNTRAVFRQQLLAFYCQLETVCVWGDRWLTHPIRTASCFGARETSVARVYLLLPRLSLPGAAAEPCRNLKLSPHFPLDVIGIN